MSEQIDRRADTTRLQILRAAAHQFAHTPYSLVSLDDILAEAEVTKGAMYFHFRSKHALAIEIVESRAEQGRKAVDEVLARKLSGLETLIDISYLIAVDDIGDESARAALNLLESIGRTGGLQATIVKNWMTGITAITRQAVADGDIPEDRDPEAISRLLVSMYLGHRQTADLGAPEQFLLDMEGAWALMLPGFANPDRIGYLKQFVRRRTAAAAKKATPIRADV